MHLSDEEKRMYEGEYGRGVQKAINMLIEYGDVWDAERMVSVDRAHVGLWSEYDWIASMLEDVQEIKVPLATIHPGYAAASRYGTAMGLNTEICEKERKDQNNKVDLLVSKGCVPTLTCTPFVLGNVPTQGSRFSWPGSMGIIFANSLFGAMGNRDAFTAALSSAITGVTPEMLLMKKEHRYGQLLFKVEELDMASFTQADYGVIGFYVGGIAKVKNVVLDGIPSNLPMEKIKHLFAPMAVSGAVAVCHIVGTTPEAPTAEEALGHKKPEETIRIGKKEFKETLEKLHTAKKDNVELVLIGCPHTSITEIAEIARLLENKKIADGVRLFIATAEAIHAFAKRMGYIDMIEQAGGLVITDTCPMLYPYGSLSTDPASTVSAETVKLVATNSGKLGAYQAKVGVSIQYGDTKSCINSAIAGKWGG